ncbi:hypothetical protein ACRU44_12625 [Mycobacterium colombiense]
MLTQSQIRAWSTQHLTSAASYWNQTADQWEDAFLTMRNQSHAMTWLGAGGDGLRQRTGADLSTVSTKADQLRQAAGVARSGASDISSAKQRVLFAIEDAQNAGFDVGEDLSVSYPDHGGSPAQQAARQAQAEQMASEIWSRAKQLEGTDSKVAGQISSAAGDVGNVAFAPGAATSAPAHNRNGNGNGVQLVDFKQDGGPQPGQPIPPQPPSIKIQPHPNPPAVINAHVGENPTPDPGKHHCDGWDVTQHVGESVGGPLITTGSVLGGIAASPLGPPEWAAAIGGALTGIATTIGGFKGLEGCE